MAVSFVTLVLSYQRILLRRSQFLRVVLAWVLLISKHMPASEAEALMYINKVRHWLSSEP